MANDESIDTERHQYHGWPIRVTCEFQATVGQFAARSFVTPAGMHERETPGQACVQPQSVEAKGQALKAAKRYIDKMLVD